MMRQGQRLAVAVRRDDGQIVVWQDRIEPFLTQHKWLNVPLLRGIVSAFESVLIGYRALAQAANMHVEGEGGKAIGAPVMALIFAGSLGIALVLMILIPSLVASAASQFLGKGRILAVVDGIARMAIVLGYIGGIAAMPRIRRYFEYHGAEHRTVAAFEAGDELTVENAQRFGLLHPRCGTSLVALVVMVKFLLLPLFGWSGWGNWLLVRFLALPVAVGVSMEALKAAGKHQDVRPLQWLLAPGMWLQRLTAREPTDAQVEVAIRALRAVLEPNG